MSSAAGQNISQLIAWGDSLTAGDEDGSGVTYPNQLQEITRLPVVNLGIGGQTSSQIAVRMNAYAGQSEQTFASGFTLPTSGTVTVTFQAGFDPSGAGGGYYHSGVPIQFVVGGVTYSGTVFNDVFTPQNYPSSQIAVSSGQAWTAILPANALHGCQIIWAGRNNSSNPSQVEADVAAMVKVAKANSGCYLVMSIINSALDGPPNSFANSQINAGNAALSASYLPSGHYLDIRSILIASYNPANGADVIDHSNDIPPYSLRAQDSSGALTAAVSSTTTCAITFGGNNVGATYIVTIGSEEIDITGGSNGAWTCTRGYAGTTSSTYATGQAYTGVDPLHLGQNLTSTANPIGNQNGYSVVATNVAIWLNGLATH